MADTGENRQITGRANAKEEEAVRASKKRVSEERSTENAGDVAFGGAKNGSRRPTAGRRQPGSTAKAPKK
jgi:hypothetical protein